MNIKNSILRFLQETGKSLAIMWRNPSGRTGLVIFVVILFLSLIGPYIIPFPQDADVQNIYQSPSIKHIFGTNYAGKDNFALIVHGGREILALAFVAGLVTTSIAVVIGSLSGFLGGKTDAFLMEVVNFWLTIPQFPLLVVLASLITLNSSIILAVLLGVLGWPGLARQIRSQVLSLKRRDFIESAIVLDLGIFHIITRELLPNIMSYIAISMVFAMTSAIFQQTGLVFLGLVPLTGSNWGVMLSLAYSKGAIFNSHAVWNVLSPVFMIIIFELSLVLISRSLDDVFNPRLRVDG
jgi:peptide/nickel transport system permease protein